MKQLLYHIPQAYFTLRSNISRKKCISQILKEFISLKKDLSINKSFFFGKTEQYRYSICRRHSRKKVVATASRRECVYKRTGKPSEPFYEKGRAAK